MGRERDRSRSPRDRDKEPRERDKGDKERDGMQNGRRRSRSRSPVGGTNIRRRSRSKERDRRRGSRSPPRRDRVRRSRSRSKDRRRTSRSPRRDRGERRRRDKLPKSSRKKAKMDLDSCQNVDEEMMKIMGFGNFSTSKEKHVEGNLDGVIQINKPRRYRQYMNRKGGFNRPLDYIA